MLSDKEIDAAAEQLADYKRNDALTDILSRYETLLDSYKRLKSDYEEEREGRERYKQLARGQERNPFVLVLVDADGYVFNDALISAGAEGGTRAAQLLNNTIKASQRRKGLEHCEIVVRAYANIAGLSKALCKAGLCGADKRSLAPFIANFNRSYPFTDFVDAGELKENADFKLRALLRLYAENAQCKHIFFAACHDAGYISELSPYRGSRDRFTLISTSGLLFHDEFTKLDLGIEELPGVFRTTGSAMDSVYPKPPQPATLSLNKAPVAQSTPAKNLQAESGEICIFFQQGKCKYGDHCKKIHVGPTSTPTLRSSKLARAWRSDNGSVNASEYNHTSISGNPTKTTPRTFLQQLDTVNQLPNKHEIPAGHVAVNKLQQRLDAYIPPPNSGSETRLKARSAVHRLCNSKHLTGSCANPACDYDHAPLDEELKPILEWLARSLPCPKRDRCRNAACTFGHVCQKPDCKHRGGKAPCKLGYSMHFNDLTVDRYVPSISRTQSNGGVLERSTPSPASDEEVDDDAEEEDEEEEGTYSSSQGQGVILISGL